MKKLSLLLALLLALSVCLVACGGDNAEDPKDESSDVSSPADNSDEEPSEEPSDEPSEDPSEDPSEEPSEEPSEPSEPSEPVGPKGTNIAPQATYTTSNLYRMGGADVGWGWDENAAISYPDDGNELTDGAVAEDTDYQNPVWMGLSDSTPDATEKGYSWITLDFGAAKKINYIKLFTASDKVGADQSAGIGAPSVSFYGSNDGTNWESLSDHFLAVEDASGCFAVAEVAFEGEFQYIEARMTRGGWTFVCEMEVYAE